MAATTLRLDIPQLLEAPVTLTVVVPPSWCTGSPLPAKSIPHKFEIFEELCRDAAYVFRGRLQLEASDDATIDAICKLSWNAEEAVKASLDVEAGYYTSQLLTLQGRAVPHFFGLYTCESPNDEEDQPVSCIILQDGGDRIPYAMFSMNDEDPVCSRQIVKALLEIHSVGLLPHEFNAKSVVHRHEAAAPDEHVQAFIVGFGHAQLHDCRFPFQGGIDRVRMKDWEPDVMDFGCQHLFYNLHQLGIWIPRTISFLGRGFSTQMLRSAEMLAQCSADVMKRGTKEDYMPRATTAYEAFHEKYGQRITQFGWLSK